MAALPAPGDTIRVHKPGAKRAYDYVVLDWPAPISDAVRAARPSRKHPGDFCSGSQVILLDWIVD